jgi:hypothetical protein
MLIHPGDAVVDRIHSPAVVVEVVEVMMIVAAVVDTEEVAVVVEVIEEEEEEREVMIMITLITREEEILVIEEEDTVIVIETAVVVVAVIVTIAAVEVVAVLDSIITGVVALVMIEVEMIEAPHPPLNVLDLLWPNAPFQLNPLLSKQMPVLMPVSVPMSNLRNLNPIRSGEQLLLIQLPSLQH